MSSARFNRRTVVIWTVVGIAVVLALGYGASMQETAEDVKAKEQLLELRSALRLGMRAADVLTTWDTEKYPLLRLDGSEKKPDESENVRWVFRTPTRWHARNWCLLVVFHNGAVTKILVRTLDSEDIKPDASPPDKIQNSGDKILNRAVSLNL